MRTTKRPPRSLQEARRTVYEDEFFYEVERHPKGSEAVEQMQELDPEWYDSDDLQSEYQNILDKHNIKISIKRVKIKSDGSVQLSIQESVRNTLQTIIREEVRRELKRKRL
jgi:hypothetical protein